LKSRFASIAAQAKANVNLPLQIAHVRFIKEETIYKQATKLQNVAKREEVTNGATHGANQNFI
jgi:hypothetical protein